MGTRTMRGCSGTASAADNDDDDIDDDNVDEADDGGASPDLPLPHLQQRGASHLLFGIKRRGCRCRRRLCRWLCVLSAPHAWARWVFSRLPPAGPLLRFLTPFPQPLSDAGGEGQDLVAHVFAEHRQRVHVLRDFLQQGRQVGAWKSDEAVPEEVLHCLCRRKRGVACTETRSHLRRQHLLQGSGLEVLHRLKIASRSVGRERESRE